MCKKNVKISFIVILSFIAITAIVFSRKEIEKRNISNDTNNETLNLEQTDEDYAQYVNKIWVVDTDLGIDEWMICSFYITEIKENKIEGQFSRIQTVQRDHYLYGKESEPIEQAYQGMFSGYVAGETAQCDFDDGRGFAGQLSMTF